jgi:hypothetical protein
MSFYLASNSAVIASIVTRFSFPAQIFVVGLVSLEMWQFAGRAIHGRVCAYSISACELCAVTTMGQSVNTASIPEFHSAQNLNLYWCQIVELSVQVMLVRLGWLLRAQQIAANDCQKPLDDNKSHSYD